MLKGPRNVSELGRFTDFFPDEEEDESESEDDDDDESQEAANWELTFYN